MAGKVPKGKRFVKGQTGNPKGSSARRRILKETARLTAMQVHEVAAVILHGNQDDLKALAKDPNATVLQMWTASLVTKSIQKGDSQVYRVLMERLLGRPKESVELTGADGKPVSLDVATRGATDDELLARAQVLFAQRQEAGDD
jgi:hypothetical protein